MSQDQQNFIAQLLTKTTFNEDNTKTTKYGFYIPYEDDTAFIELNITDNKKLNVGSFYTVSVDKDNNIYVGEELFTKKEPYIFEIKTTEGNIPYMENKYPVLGDTEYIFTVSDDAVSFNKVVDSSLETIISVPVTGNVEEDKKLLNDLRTTISKILRRNKTYYAIKNNNLEESILEVYQNDITLQLLSKYLSVAEVGNNFYFYLTTPMPTCSTNVWSFLIQPLLFTLYLRKFDPLPNKPSTVKIPLGEILKKVSNE